MGQPKEMDIDCLGDMCPVPMMKLKSKEGELLKGSSIKMITDHSCVCESIRNYCNTLNYNIEIEEPLNGVWEIYISAKSAKGFFNDAL